MSARWASCPQRAEPDASASAPTTRNLFIDSLADRFAHVLLQFPGRRERESTGERVGFGEGLGIFDREIHGQMAEIRAAVALDEVHLVAVRLAGRIEPGFVVEADGVDHQGVTVPLAD